MGIMASAVIAEFWPVRWRVVGQPGSGGAERAECVLASSLDTADRHRRVKLAWKFPYHTTTVQTRWQAKEEKLFARTVSVEWCGRWMVDGGCAMHDAMGRAQGLHASRRLAVSDVSGGMELLPPPCCTC